MEYLPVIKNLLGQCIAEDKKNIVLIYDASTVNLLSTFEEALTSLGKSVDANRLDVAGCHGSEPTDEVAEKMASCDTIVCLTKYSLAHTAARKEAESKGVPFLSMPDYSPEILDNPAFSVIYKDRYPVVNRYSNMLSDGNQVHITTPLGTDLWLDICGRLGNCCPGMTTGHMLLGSPPDIEANIAPIERASRGRLIIDGSITDYRIGLLEKPIELIIEKGAIVEASELTLDEKGDIIGRDKGAPTVGVLWEILEATGDEKSRIIGELGIGFNNKAKLSGNMLIDEGTQGSVHFGFGSNWTIGGENKVSFHLDFVMMNPTVTIDGQGVIEGGKILFE